MSPDVHVLNLDTCVISALARDPGRDDCRAVLKLLEHGDNLLAFSIVHALELAKTPVDTSRREITNLLRDTPVVFSVPREMVEEDEIAYAIARATGHERRRPRVFVRSLRNWGKRVIPDGYGASDMIEHFHEDVAGRDDFFAAIQELSALEWLKSRSLLTRHPAEPTRLAVQCFLDEMRARNPTYAGNLAAEEVIKRVGGVSGFPARHVMDQVVALRLRTAKQKPNGNHLLDDYIACYAPYASITQMDGPATQRIIDTKVQCATRVVRDLKSIPPLLARIRAGEITLHPPEIFD